MSDDDESEVVGPPEWLANLRGEAAGLFEDIPEPTATDAIKHDRFDEATWSEARSNVPSIENMITEHGKEQDYVDDFFQDFFNLMIKADPELRSSGEMKPSHSPNQAMVEHFSKYSELQDLRQYTTGDTYAATMGILSMETEIEETYARMEEARRLAEQAAQAAQDARDKAGQAQQALADDEIDVTTAQQLIDVAQQAVGTCGSMQAGARAAAGNAAQARAGAIRSKAKKTADELQADQDLMNAFGIDPGELQRMDFQERFELAKRLRNNRLAKFAKLIGQFRQFAQAERRRRVKHTPDEVTGIRFGDDLTRLHPTELVNLAAPELEDDFWRRYAEHNLVTWELTGTEKMGRGPIVFVCDESGSMNSTTDVGASREAWSKAFALALLDQARRDNRDFVYIGFSSEGQQWHSMMAGGKAPIAQIIEFTEHFFNGGTHYQKPLSQALAIVQEYGTRNLPKPDVVFVTDDEYSGGLEEEFVQEWNAAREKLSMKCYGIGMGINPHRSGAMIALCDNVRSIDRMSHDVTTVADIFREI